MDVAECAAGDSRFSQPEYFPFHVMTRCILLPVFVRNLDDRLHLLGAGDCGEQSQRKQKSCTMHHGINLRWNRNTYFASPIRHPFEGKTDSMEKPTIRGHVSGLPVFTPMAA
jgi:hypothetical protein